MAVTWAKRWHSRPGTTRRERNARRWRPGKGAAVATPKVKTPNEVLRRIREIERRESRQEFAAAVQNAGRQQGDRHLACDAKQVARWEDGDTLCPQPVYQRALSALLGRPFDELGFRLRDSGAGAQGGSESTILRTASDSAANSIAAASHVARIPALADALAWLDQHADWPTGQSGQQLSDAITNLDSAQLDVRRQRRGSVSRDALAAALAAYYRPTSPNRFYTARCAGRPIMTSVLTRPQWVDLALPLRQGHDTITLDPVPKPNPSQLSDTGTKAALRRLTEAAVTGTRLVNAPLYLLHQIEVSPAKLTGSVSLAHFVDYAMTLDLLEPELTDAIANGLPIMPGHLPLRDEYLPDTSAVLNIERRVCAGGPLALTAIARSSRARRGKPPDYVLLVQERSASVLNATGRLAVIPKAFHQPIVDYADDAQIGSTIEREMEEELFGRPELDSTFEQPRMADPMHADRLTAPMRWLVGHGGHDEWRIECTAFGINAVSGTFEVASLIVIDNPSWWDEFGGVIQANWEAEGLRRYSSLDRDQLAALVHDPAWSNEGIFAFCQALRRLSQVGAERACIPAIDLEDMSG
jgi:hypothetical protein